MYGTDCQPDVRQSIACFHLDWQVFPLAVDVPPMPSIQPAMRPMRLELVTLGARGLQSTLQRWLSRRGLQEVVRASLGAWRSYAERLARSMRMEEHVRVQRGLQIYADVLLCWLVPPSVSPLPQALLV